MHHHIEIQGPALREFHIVVAEYLVDDCLLSVDYLVMRKRKQMSLIVEIVHRKSELLRNTLSLIRLLHKIVQSVIHPAKVPLVIKSETAQPGRLRPARIGCGILRNQHGGRMESVKTFIQLLQEIDGCLVHTALLIAHPVDNTAYGIHAQTVEMVLRQPVIGCGHHEAHDFPAGIDEISSSPLAVGDVTCRILV